MTDKGQTDVGPPRSEAETKAEAKPESSPPTPAASEKEKFVVWFTDLLKSTEAPNVVVSDAVRENWAECYDRMIRLDGRSKEEIKAVCRWAREDAFWRKNFLSPMKLRDKKDGVMWFDAFAAKMNDKGPPGEKVRVNIVDESQL